MTEIQPLVFTRLESPFDKELIFKNNIDHFKEYYNQNKKNSFVIWLVKLFSSSTNNINLDECPQCVNSFFMIMQNYSFNVKLIDSCLDLISIENKEIKVSAIKSNPNIPVFMKAIHMGIETIFKGAELPFQIKL